MLDTLLCAAALLLYFIGILKTPKKEEKNGFESLVIGTILLIILTGGFAAIYSFIGIPVNLASTAASVFLMAAVLWIRCIRQRQLAHGKWPVMDAVSLCVVCIPVILISINRFGITLDLTYADVDPARYMLYAMDIVNVEKVHGQFLTSYINAMFIEFFSPFLMQVSYYRAMVLSDIFIHLLSVMMFYLLISQLNRGKARWCNALLTIFYFGGYQLYNLCCGAFFHWVDGILLTMFLIYAALRLEREEISHVQGILYLTVGLFGLMICYPFLLVIVGPIFVPEVIIWCKDNMKKLSRKQSILLGSIVVAVACIGVFLAGKRIDYSFERLLADLGTVEGLAYREPYMDFLFFVPVFICFLGALHRHKKENRMIARMLITASAFTAVWLVLFLNGYLVAYYYYRVYYVIWLLAWLMVGQTIHLMVKEKKAFEIKAYAGFMVVVLCISLFGVNEKLWKLDERFYLNESQRDVSLCPLYTFNAKELSVESKLTLSEAELDLYSYVIENYGYEEAPMVASVYTAMQSDWYRGIIGQAYDETFYDLRYYSLYDILQNLENRGKQYFVLLLSDPMYAEYAEYVFGAFDTEYENPECVIYRRPEAGWTSVIDETDNISEEEKDLLLRVKELGVKPELVWNMEQSVEAIYTKMYLGIEFSDWIQSSDSDEFIAQTYRLNNDGVEYLLVWKESEIYQGNREYFKAQEILLENEVGMLVSHAGSGWMPSEQE